jgi:hypothetical protein
MLDKVYTYSLKECERPGCLEMVPRESASGRKRSKYTYGKRRYHSHACSQQHSAEKLREKRAFNTDSDNVMDRFLRGKK